MWTGLWTVLWTGSWTRKPLYNLYYLPFVPRVPLKIR
nr:MAG TPA_asm: hypothetical protein [Caudoviricetes sp.]